MKLHRNIDHDWQMTPIDFQVTRSLVALPGSDAGIDTVSADGVTVYRGSAGTLPAFTGALPATIGAMPGRCRLSPGHYRRQPRLDRDKP
ncbi:hypothetical protein DPMN_026548 [Dreissena polymorpha]|uniref:Uncharacterized protein n=1 Tax=Dreissena polymorpha TaxID=45954 RepID=A0A9D4LTL9_DREPO|nr:hypothetical protein DPMN_026548 [Dreissena polymorpha]